MNNSVKSFFIWNSVSGEDVILKISYQELWHPSCWRNGTIYAILVEGNMGYIHVKVFYIWKRCHLREKLAHCGHMADEDQS